MKIRDGIFLFVGFMVGAIVTIIYIFPDHIVRSAKMLSKQLGYVYFKKGSTPRQWITKIHVRERGTLPDGNDWERWPPPHAGGSQPSAIYKWAADYIRSTGKSKPEAFDAVSEEFPDYVSREKLTSNQQYNAFRKGVDRELKKAPETPEQ
jgi:hypothetical protein